MTSAHQQSCEKCKATGPADVLIEKGGVTVGAKIAYTMDVNKRKSLTSILTCYEALKSIVAEGFHILVQDPDTSLFETLTNKEIDWKSETKNILKINYAGSTMNFTFVNPKDSVKRLPIVDHNVKFVTTDDSDELLEDVAEELAAAEELPTEQVKILYKAMPSQTPDDVERVLTEFAAAEEFPSKQMEILMEHRFKCLSSSDEIFKRSAGVITRIIGVSASIVETSMMEVAGNQHQRAVMKCIGADGTSKPILTAITSSASSDATIAALLRVELLHPNLTFDEISAYRDDDHIGFMAWVSTVLLYIWTNAGALNSSSTTKHSAIIAKMVIEWSTPGTSIIHAGSSLCTILRDLMTPELDDNHMIKLLMMDSDSLKKLAGDFSDSLLAARITKDTSGVFLYRSIRTRVSSKYTPFTAFKVSGVPFTLSNEDGNVKRIVAMDRSTGSLRIVSMMNIDATLNTTPFPCDKVDKCKRRGCNGWHPKGRSTPAITNSGGGSGSSVRKSKKKQPSSGSSVRESKKKAASSGSSVRESKKKQAASSPRPRKACLCGFGTCYRWLQCRYPSSCTKKSDLEHMAMFCHQEGHCWIPKCDPSRCGRRHRSLEELEELELRMARMALEEFESLLAPEEFDARMALEEFFTLGEIGFQVPLEAIGHREAAAEGEEQ
jgi:hypothetical protein